MQGEKSVVGVSTSPPKMMEEISHVLQWLTGVRTRPISCMTATSLGNVGQIIHPTIMYGLLKGREHALFDESEIPLFYQGIDEQTAQYLEMVSKEVVEAARMLSEKSGGLLDLSRVSTLGDWLLTSYGEQISDKSSLRTCFTTNKSYTGLKAPMVKSGPRFMPDFQSRYLTEDVPFGLLVTRGIARICGVCTPVIDEVIINTSKWMRVEYLVEGLPRGKDIHKTRHPINFGIDGVDGIISANTWECRLYFSTSE